MNDEVANNQASVEALRFHYDLPTEFYRLWLDPTLTYSAALWQTHDPESVDLHAAQLRKLDFACATCRAGPGARVLDVGCGYGGLLARLIDSWGVEQAVGLTLSRTQAEYARRTLPARAQVRLESWHEHVPAAPYDALCSIGAFEHFARCGLSPEAKLDAYRRFFVWCHAALRPGAAMYLQTMAYGTAAAISDFFTSSVFPESDLPRLSEICAAAEGLFEVCMVRNDRLDYERTTGLWLRKLRAQRAAAEQFVPRETVERYQRYLGMAAIGFHVGTQVLYRIGLQRLGER